MTRGAMVPLRQVSAGGGELVRRCSMSTAAGKFISTVTKAGYGATACLQTDARTRWTQNETWGDALVTNGQASTVPKRQFGIASFSFLLASALTGVTPASAQLAVISEAALVDPHSTETIVRSAINGRSYRVRIWNSAQANERKGPVPNLYVLDGETDAGMAAAISSAVEQPGDAPAVRVISVAAIDDVREQSFKRIKSPALPREFLHRPLTVKWADAPFAKGDGAGFQRFLLEELRPLVQERYPGPTRSALFGDGMAATFVLALAAERPDDFQLYVANRPWLDDATAAIIAGIVKPRASKGYSTNLLLTTTRTPHLFNLREARLGAAFQAKGHRAEHRDNFAREDLLVNALELLRTQPAGSP